MRGKIACAPMDPAALRNRLVMATAMWREATEEPLPQDAARATPRSRSRDSSSSWSRCCSPRPRPRPRRKVADQTWDLVHDRPDDDPVKRRVVAGHEALAQARRRGRRPQREVVTPRGPLFSRAIEAARALGFLFIGVAAWSGSSRCSSRTTRWSRRARCSRSGGRCGDRARHRAACADRGRRGRRCTPRWRRAPCIVGAANYFVGPRRAVPDHVHAGSPSTRSRSSALRGGAGSHGADRRVVRGGARRPGRTVEPGRALAARASARRWWRAAADRAAARARGANAHRRCCTESEARTRAIVRERAGRLRHDRPRRRRSWRGTARPSACSAIPPARPCGRDVGRPDVRARGPRGPRRAPSSATSRRRRTTAPVRREVEMIRDGGRALPGRDHRVAGAGRGHARCSASSSAT